MNKDALHDVCDVDWIKVAADTAEWSTSVNMTVTVDRFFAVESR